MELNAIHHVAINVADYDRSREFYVDKLGFQILGEYVFPSGTRRLDCCLAGCRLELFWSRRAMPRPEGTLQGYRHLAFRVRDIRKAVSDLEAVGIFTDDIRQDTMGGGLMTFFRDPDGLELELYQQEAPICN